MGLIKCSIHRQLLLIGTIVLTCFANYTFSKSMILKISLYDCNTCYYGITILQDSLLKHHNHIYLFESRYQPDSTALIERFNINRSGSFIIYSDSLYGVLSKNRMSELIITDSNFHMQESMPIAKIEKSTIKNIRQMLNTKHEVPSSFVIDYLPADYTFKASSNQLIVKNQIDNSHAIYDSGNLKYKIKLNIDSIYQKIQSQYPGIDNGYDYKKFIVNDVSMKPQLNSLCVIDDSVSYGFATVFYIERYDSVVYNDYLAKKELFLLQFVLGRVVTIFRIDQSKLLEKGYGINEYGNFHISNQYVYYSIGKLNYMNDTTSSCVARYKFNANELKFESITQISSAPIYKSHHPSFQDKSIMADDEILTMPFSNVLINLVTNKLYELPLSKNDIINTNPQFVNYGIWDILKRNKKIVLIYSIKKKLYIGQYDTETKYFLTQQLVMDDGSIPALTKIDNEIYVVHIHRNTKRVTYLPVRFK